MEKPDLTKENEKLHQLMTMAKLGWWEADFTTMSYTCSDFVADLLMLKGNTLTFLDFRNMIREDYRTRISNEFISIKESEVYEQTFPIYSKYGEIWVHSKLNSKEYDPNKHLIALGFLQCVDNPEQISTGEAAVQRMNNLLYQQNIISRTLSSFLQKQDLTELIHQILKEILMLYNGGRGYIFEYDLKNQTQSCTYEVLKEGVTSTQNELQNIPLVDTPWWNSRILSGKPIILSNVKNIESPLDYKMLVKMGIKSIMAVPMIHKDGVWGFLGVDVMDGYRTWPDEDYQWLASLANIICICISLRKSELKALEEQRYLEKLYKHMPVGYIRFHISYDTYGNAVDYHFVDMNDMAANILEYDRDGFIGVKASNLGLDIKQHLPVLLELIENNSYKEINFKLDKLGKYCHSIAYSPQKNEIVIMFSDMTETFTTHEALARNEKILNNVYRNLPAGVELYDEEGILLDLNDKDLEIFGIQNKEAVVGKVNIFKHPLISDDLKERIRNKEDLDFTFRYNFDNLGDYYLSRKRTVIDLLTKVTTLYDSQNNFINYLFINTDISEMKEAEAKLIEAKNKAETLDRLKSAFLANMSHEIRTPLNAIVGFSNLLVECDNPEERRQYIGIVQDNNELLLQLISDILDLSKIEAGTFDFVKDIVEVHQLCEEIIYSFNMKATENVKIILEENLQEYYLYSDKHRLTQVITNFINNALKFTSQGFIKLGFRAEGKNILFYVKDTGIGIAEDKRNTIFDRFVKLNSFVHGTGLGLSICKSLVEQMGGEIGLSSKEGDGSCFWFTHPYDPQLKPVSEEVVKTLKDADIQSCSMPTNDRPVILIAEDTDSNYLLISSILRKEYSLIRAHNGKEAIDHHQKHHPAIILMDIKMPIMNGIEATRIIRQQDNHTPIIAVTAFAFDQDRQRTLEAGCNDFLTKPVSGPSLKEVIKKWLERK